MTDQAYFTAPIGTDNSSTTLVTTIPAGLAKARLRTILRYTSGPQTLVTGTVDLVTCDAAGGSFTVNLPTAPINGESITFKKETAGNTLTIGRSAKTIDFVAADSTLTTALSKLVLVWSTSANTWLTL